MSAPSIVRACRPLLGTYVEIQVPLRGSDELLPEAFRRIEFVQKLMSFHDPASELSRINRAPAETPVRVHDATWSLLSTALRFAEISSGVFDPTVAPRLCAWKFLPPPETTAPDCKATWRNVLLPEPGLVVKQRPLWLDLGGIAKGYAVDLAFSFLAAERLGDISVNAGGDLRAIGMFRNRLQVRDPRSRGKFVELAMQYDAAATSGTDQTLRFRGLRRVSHLLNPLNGRAINRRMSVTAFANTCTTAEVCAKVALLASPAQAASFLRANQAAAIRLPDLHTWNMLAP